MKSVLEMWPSSKRRAINWKDSKDIDELLQDKIKIVFVWDP